MTFPLETIVAWSKRRWFVYPGSSIYGWLANARDYGPYGIQLKKNIQDLRRTTFVQQREDIIGLDSQILMHPKVRETSGHVDNFDDPLIDDKNTGERFRADKLIENKIEEVRQKLLKDNPNMESDRIDAALFDKYHQEYEVKNLIPESRSFEQMKEFIKHEIPQNPNTKKKAERTDVRKFQMMFYTYQGVVHDETNKVWLRPETAQGIFINFRNILDTTRMRVPFGIAQVGKAFRNEITPGNFLYRTREFEQMEIEFFIEPTTKSINKWMKHRKEESWKRRTQKLGIKEDNIRLRDHEDDELSHYSTGTTDIEYQFPRWWWELQAAAASRTDYDLKAHQTQSHTNMQYTDPQSGERYIPFVIEPSFWLSRSVLAVMLDAYDEEQYTDSNGSTQTRIVARLDKKIAPVSFAILPLVKKDTQQTQLAKNIFKQLISSWFTCELDDSGAIGKRYRRQDEIGTPFCITVDEQTTKDHTVTVRERDTMQQERCNIDRLHLYMQ